MFTYKRYEMFKIYLTGLKVRLAISNKKCYALKSIRIGYQDQKHFLL